MQKKWLQYKEERQINGTVEKHVDNPVAVSS